MFIIFFIYLFVIIYIICKMNIYVKNNSNDFFGSFNKESRYGFFPFQKKYIYIYFILLIIFSCFVFFEKLFYNQNIILYTFSYIYIYIFVYSSTILYILFLLYYYEFLMRFFSFNITYLFFYHLFINFFLLYSYGFSIYFYFIFLFICFLFFIGSKKIFFFNKANKSKINDNIIIQKSSSSIDKVRFKNKL